MKRRYDLIIFDWDGTLCDSTALIVQAIQRACADVGATVPSREAASHVIGLGLLDALAHVAPEVHADQYPLLADRYRHHYFSKSQELILFEGTLSMLQHLKDQHHWLAVATGKSRHGLNEALQTAALKGVFDATRTADETASKPHPQMLLELLREFGLDPEQALMIGDTTHDLQLAQNAGCDAVAVSFGAHPHEAFQAYTPRFVAHSTPELHHWLQDHA